MREPDAPPAGAAFAAFEARVLELVARARPLGEIFLELIAGFESLWPGAVASVQLMEPDGQSLRVAAGPRLPETHRAPELRYPVGPRHGSCGTAVFRKEPVIVADIEHDDLWADWTYLALPFGLRACWSVPVFGEDGQVLATFAVYHREVTSPARGELAIVQQVATLVGIAIGVDQRERELRERQAMLEIAARVGQMGAWKVEVPSLRQVWSDEALHLIGAPPGRDVPRREVHRLFSAESRALLDSAFAQCASQGQAFDHEVRLTRFDGREVWLRVIGKPVRDDAERIVAVHGAIQDISQTAANRAALVESQERFELLSRATNDAIRDWDVVSDVMWWNDGYHQLFGHDPARAARGLASWSDQIHRDEREAVLGRFRAALEGDATTWSAEYGFMHASGDHLHVLDRILFLRSPEGRAVRLVGAMSDITERKHAEERMREQATLLDQASDAIVVMSLDHRIRYWNQSAAKLYGWSVSEAIGASLELLVHEDPVRFARAAEHVLETGQWIGELEQVTRAGKRLQVEARWTLVRDALGAPQQLLALHTDVTERKRLENQFLRAQRLESIGTLAGGIAHDLNNMLAPIILTTSAMRAEPGHDGILEELATIQSCAERGAEMVRQLLVFARGTDGKRGKISIRSVAHDVLKFMRETLPKNIEVQLEAADDLWEIEADGTQVHQLLTNLCVNARDALPNGGTLTIALENTTLDEVYTGMNLEARPGPYVLARIEDTGVGMPAEVLDRIFEPFYTTKEFGQGTGLGLSTVHAIVRGHRGFIHVYSEVGRGTRFKIYLPAATYGGEPNAPHAGLVQVPRGRGELVLLVDDEELIRHVSTRMLERHGYRVVTAANGAEAVALFAQRQQQVDVVVTDMSMPVMDGPATIVALRAIDPEVRIIGCSGLAANGHVARAIDAGVDIFIPKPYGADVMLRAIRKALER